ncbi:TonB-dependent siderophore receptor [Vibrio cholerae]
MNSHHQPIVSVSTLALAIAVTLSGGAYAETQSDNASDETLTVWGTQVSSSSEFLGDQDISIKQADHMSDLLRSVPAVDVGGTHSVNQRITIRSLGETDLDIRLDGASQHANMFHHIGNLTLNPDILKAVDIQVGNNSVTQSGLGGAVYFETKDARDLLRYNESFGVRVYGGVASNDSRQGSVTAYGLLNDRIDAMVYANYVERDDFKDGNGDTTYGAAGDVSNMLFKLGYEPSYLHRFQLSYDLYRDEGDYSPRPDMGGSANTELSGEDLIPTQYDRDTFTGSYELRGDNHQGKVTLYSSTTQIDRDESAITGRWPANRHAQNTAKNQNLGATAQFQSSLMLAERAHRFTYGLEYMDKTSESAYGGTPFMQEHAKSSAGYLEDKIQLSPSFALTAGLRYDHYIRDAETSKDTFNEWTWALGADWDITKQWTLFASTRSLFKGPELLETFIAYQDVAYLADDIKAETGLSSEVGARYFQRFDQHAISANLTLFQNEIDDYIGESYQDDGSYLIENIGDAEIKGFELSAAYSYQALSARASYARSDTTNQSTGGPLIAANGRSMDVGDSISLGIDYEFAAIDTTVGWTSIIVLEEDNVKEDQPVKEAYNTHDLYAQWRPSQLDRLQVTFGIDNIFDEAYTSHASRSGAARGATLDDLEPGRNYKLSASYEF